MPLPCKTASLLLAALLAGTVPARADDGDQDRVLRALRGGQVLPLPQLLERLSRTHPGQVLEIELESEDGRWVYEIRLLQPDGRLARLAVDAGSGDLLQVKPRKREHR